MSENPTVSVVIPAFNAAPTIARALDSVLNQTLSFHEIIVVDDASTDATRDIVACYAARNVRLLASPSRLGASGARNAGIECATGDIIAFLDSDDEWLPTKLEKQVALIKSDPGLCFVACAASLISPVGADLGDCYDGQPVVTGAAAWKALLAYNFVLTSTVLVWRRIVMAVGGFDTRLKVGEDQDLWIRLALAGAFGSVRESLVRKHVRADSLSSWALDDMLTYTLPMVERHIVALNDRLTAREIRQIRGERLGRCGRVAYARGQVASGMSLLGRAMLLGYQPLESARHIALASPPAKWLKQQLRFRTSP
jgi:glycosyltransferase involved in cell wall biosynthesis